MKGKKASKKGRKGVRRKERKDLGVVVHDFNPVCRRQILDAEVSLVYNSELQASKTINKKNKHLKISTKKEEKEKKSRLGRREETLVPANNQCLLNCPRWQFLGLLSHGPADPCLLSLAGIGAPG